MHISIEFEFNTGRNDKDSITAVLGRFFSPRLCYLAQDISICPPAIVVSIVTVDLEEKIKQSTAITALFLRLDRLHHKQKEEMISIVIERRRVTGLFML